MYLTFYIVCKSIILLTAASRNLCFLYLYRSRPFSFCSSPDSSDYNLLSRSLLYISPTGHIISHYRHAFIPVPLGCRHSSGRHANCHHTSDPTLGTSQVSQFLRDPQNRKTIATLLAWRKLAQSLDAPQKRITREVPPVQPRSLPFNASNPLYNYEEQHLFHSPSPLATRMNSRRVTVQLVKTGYADCCQDTPIIKGSILQLKCIQYFIMFDQDRLGDLSQYGFSKEETDVNIAEATRESDY
ncbi:hypothetical protein RvY_10755-1 [Ramazzottius varieornatus]|uniref:Uncharacterized protein n=1 Tax=Ramazzottius varieornatus TaxID=947166 RepID=A0A1D1VLM8_RAMVA|nr:hypothetical protein RvY_10755-1 [Ramazzottius varieornatus]